MQLGSSLMTLERQILQCVSIAPSSKTTLNKASGRSHSFKHSILTSVNFFYLFSNRFKNLDLMIELCRLVFFIDKRAQDLLYFVFFNGGFLGQVRKMDQANPEII